jgi:hypothetical protein
MDPLTANGAPSHGATHLIRAPDPAARLRHPDERRAGKSGANGARADFFKDMRASVDLDALDDPDLPALRPRARRTLSQPRCAARMNISDKHLRNLENGAAWTEDLVRRFEHAVGLAGRNDPEAVEQRIALWDVALARRPPGLVRAVGAADRLKVAREPEPTFIAGDDWDLLLYNKACLAWFPEWADGLINVLGEDGINVLDYVLGEFGEANLPDWEQSWVIPMLAQVRLTLASAGTHDRALYDRLQKRLTRLRRRSDVVDHAWELKRYRLGPNGRIRSITIPVYEESDGVRRVIGRRKLQILLWTSVIPGTTNTRITTLYPEPWDYDEQEVVLPQLSAA